MPEKNKIGYIPYYDVIYRNKSDSYAVLIGLSKNARTNFFLRSSSRLDDFTLKTASRLVFNNNLCF